MLKKKLIINTKVNKNNRMYSMSALEAMKKQINSGNKDQNIGILENIDDSGIIAIDQVAFTYENAVIEKDSLYVDILPLKTNAGKKLQGLLETEFVVFRPVGNAEMPDSVGIGQAMDILKIPQKVNGDYFLITIAAILASEDSLVD